MIFQRVGAFWTDENQRIRLRWQQGDHEPQCRVDLEVLVEAKTLEPRLLDARNQVSIVPKDAGAGHCPPG